MIYVVEAYRWGNTNAHRYIVAVTTDLSLAKYTAQKECKDRGGKYGIEVLGYTGSVTIDKHDLIEEPTIQNIAYHPSMNGEKKPFHNNYISSCERIGQTVTGSTAEMMKQLPKWLKKAVNEEKRILRKLEKDAKNA